MPKRPKCAHQLLNHIYQTLRTQQILLPPTRPLLAISGGQDSLTLAESFHLLNKKHALWPTLCLVHCDHGWPGDDPIPHHVSFYAKSRDLPLHIIRADPPPAQTEAAGREWRYQQLALLAKSKGYDAVVTGHTMTDAAETVLHAMCRGWGSGLGGMKWERRLVDGVMLVRPLLGVCRKDTERFCRERGLQVWKDTYNEDERFARNRVRKRVIPILEKEVNERVQEALWRVGRVVGDEAEFVEDIAAKAYDRLVQVKDREWLVDAQGLGEEHPAVQRRVIRRILGDGTRLEMVERIRAVLAGGKVEWVGGGAVCEQGVLCVWRGMPQREAQVLQKTITSTVQIV